MPIVSKPLKPYWTTTDGELVKLYHGDVISVLQKLPPKSVQCVVTSPPYWGLRDYGVKGQIGSESTPEEFVAVMVAVFREVYRVLRDDGVLWLNLGDTYSGSSMSTRHGPNSPIQNNRRSVDIMFTSSTARNSGLVPGNLVGVPWRVALALQADGWILRQEIIWAKPSTMPESVRNRCTKSHEHVFLLVKQSGYYCDMEAIKERVSPNTRGRTVGQKDEQAVVGESLANSDYGSKITGWVPTRNKRSV